MRNHTLIRVLFFVAGAYDGFLGLAFLIFPLTIFDAFEVTRPNHVGYAQFPAALLVVFALMFVHIARDPVGNRNLIPYGILLKVSYCGVVFGHWFTRDLPDLWKPFAVIDVAFALLFGWAYVLLGRNMPAGHSAAESHPHLPRT